MGRPVKHRVELSDEERQQLRGLVRRGRAPARQVTRAHILLRADAGEPRQDIAAGLGVCRRTVQQICERYATEGLTAALGERPRPGAKRKLGPKGEVTLIALACTDAPTGYADWTMQLLADRLVELQVVDSISDETVRRTLKRGP